MMHFSGNLHRCARGVVFLASLVLLLTGASHPQAPAARPAPPAELHGGIEISPRVVRAIAVRISNGDEGYNVNLLYSNSATPATNSYQRDNKLTPEYIRDMAGVVLTMFQVLQQKYQVPASQIYIIGLADLVAQNLDELGNEILTRTGRPTNFLDAATDTELSIAGNIPRRYRVGNKVFDNRGISMLIDVTNASIRGGYQQIKRQTAGPPEYEFVTWEIAKGTLAFAGEIARAAGETADVPAFAKRAQSLSVFSLHPSLQNELARRPALATRKKIYLTGSIVWAMMTLLHPEQNESYEVITQADIDTFYNRALLDPEALMNPDLSKIADETQRTEMRRARETIKATFPPKSLIAGAEILKALSVEMQFQNKRVLYPRFAWFARILSYVRLEGQ